MAKVGLETSAWPIRVGPPGLKTLDPSSSSSPKGRLAPVGRIQRSPLSPTVGVYRSGRANGGFNLGNSWPSSKEDAVYVETSLFSQEIRPPSMSVLLQPLCGPPTHRELTMESSTRITSTESVLQGAARVSPCAANSFTARSSRSFFFSNKATGQSTRCVSPAPFPLLFARYPGCCKTVLAPIPFPYTSVFRKFGLVVRLVNHTLLSTTSSSLSCPQRPPT